MKALASIALVSALLLDGASMQTMATFSGNELLAICIKQSNLAQWLGYVQGAFDRAMSEQMISQNNEYACHPMSTAFSFGTSLSNT